VLNVPKGMPVFENSYLADMLLRIGTALEDKQRGIWELYEWGARMQQDRSTPNMSTPNSPGSTTTTPSLNAYVKVSSLLYGCPENRRGI